MEHRHPTAKNPSRIFFFFLSILININLIEQKQCNESQSTVYFGFSPITALLNSKITRKNRQLLIVTNIVTPSHFSSTVNALLLF